jgi:hypothetical protein
MIRGNRFLTPYRLFRAFKYTIYLLLAWNIYLWFQEDFAAAAETFGGQVGWGNFVEAYAATIDTLAWVILLLLFELETAVIPEEKLKGGLKWLLTGLSLVCYIFIVWSFYGYWVKFGMISSVLPFHVADICSLAGGEWNVLETLDEYPPLDLGNCAALQSQQIFQVIGTDILATAENHSLAQRLAAVDIINAGAWLVVVVLLEIEVLLQLRQTLTDAMIRAAAWIKGFFYLALFGCAAYWGYDGTFLDFWDAFLWLVAFIFIELNIFQWHEDAAEEQPQGY